MDKNRFSRQLIVLRAVISGYSGHARLVHTDDGANLEVRIQSPDAEPALYAVLVERAADGYSSRLLGTLTGDGRNQFSGTYPIPEDGPMPDLLAIVQQDDDCKLAMSGFLDGPRSVNWADVRASACAAVTAQEDASTAQTLPQQEDLFAGFGETEDDPFRASTDGTAAQAAGVSPDAVWPEEIAALQEPFENQPAVRAYPGSSYTFILMPANDDQPEYLAGIRCLHNLPVRAAYAVRGEDATACPPGLETFLWRGCSDGGGYWVTYIDAQTGEPVDNDH